MKLRAMFRGESRFNKPIVCPDIRCGVDLRFNNHTKACGQVLEVTPRHATHVATVVGSGVSWVNVPLPEGTRLYALPVVYEKELLRLQEKVHRLKGLLARYRWETPIGNQPHMIAGEAEAELNGD
jgi:hypothetical protein